MRICVVHSSVWKFYGRKNIGRAIKNKNVVVDMKGWFLWAQDNNKNVFFSAWKIDVSMWDIYICNIFRLIRKYMVMDANLNIHSRFVLLNLVSGPTQRCAFRTIFTKFMSNFVRAQEECLPAEICGGFYRKELWLEFGWILHGNPNLVHAIQILVWIHIYRDALFENSYSTPTLYLYNRTWFLCHIIFLSYLGG